MLVYHEKNQDEKHAEIHSPSNSLKVSHRQRNLPGSLFVFFDSCEVPSLFINISENFRCEHVSYIFNLFLFCDYGRYRLLKVIVIFQLVG
jgi:hypothetical protein